MSRSLVVIFLVCFCTPSFAVRKSVYESLLQPLDLYSVPKDAGRVIPLPDFFRAIAKRGLGIKIAQQDLRSAELTYELAYDNYNLPRTALTANYSYGTSYGSEIKSIAKSSTFGVGLTGDFGWGLSYNLSLPQITTSVSITPAYASASEYDTATFGGSVSFSLLKGSLFFLGRNKKNEADVTWNTAKLTARSTALSTLLLAQQTYYDVMLKEARVRVLELAFASAKALLSDVSEMFSSGETDRLATVKVQLQVAQAETDLLSARSDLASALQDLKNVLATATEDSSLIYPDPGEMKRIPTIPDIKTAEAIDTAKKQRPDYLTAQLAKQRASLDVQAAFAGKLPQLDLTAGYGFVGQQNNISGALTDAIRTHFPQYSVGFVFSYSLFNDSDKTGYHTSQIALLKSDLAIEQVTNQINKEIRSAIQSVQLGSLRLKTSELARGLSEKKLQAEFEKFRLGESSIRNVIDFQSEMNNARISEIGARITLLNNLATLRNAMGELPPGITTE